MVDRGEDKEKGKRREKKEVRGQRNKRARCGQAPFGPSSTGVARAQSRLTTSSYNTSHAILRILRIAICPARERFA